MLSRWALLVVACAVANGVALVTNTRPHTTLGGPAVRADFPILHQHIWDGKPLIYLDSAATSQKPTSVLEAMQRHQEQDNANVHRGAHLLSVRSTEAYEGARDKVQRFINAGLRQARHDARSCTQLSAANQSRAQLRRTQLRRT